MYTWAQLQNNGNLTLSPNSDMDTFNAYAINEIYKLVKEGTINQDKL